MLDRRNRWIRWAAVLCIMLLLPGTTGCVKTVSDDTINPVKNQTKKEPFRLKIMSITFSGDPLKDDSPVKKKMEEYTNTLIDFIWVPNSTYNDKLNIMLASGDLPTIITVPEKTPGIVNAVRSGKLWEIGPYFKNYRNLSQANPIVLNNISIDGKIYGVYRTRPLGRNGITYRKDWLDKVGIKELKTLDDFYEMLKAFTTRDPDGNGKNDTYGLVLSKWEGPFDIMQTWFGAPNGWGEDTDGKLVPAHVTGEYMDALRFFRKLYTEKLVNPDFPVFDASRLTDPVKEEKAGCIVDVADHAQRIQDYLDREGKNAVIDVIGTVAGPKGVRNLPTSGHSGYNVISRSGAKTEEDMMKALNFLDKCNDKEMQVLITNGIEGRNYVLDAKGYLNQNSGLNLKSKTETDSLSQIGMAIPKDLFYTVSETPIRSKVKSVMSENEKITIPNPAEPLTSDTYVQKGVQLDSIIDNARTKYIIGQLDEAGFKAAVELWRKSGGNEVIKEINEEYLKYKRK